MTPIELAWAAGFFEGEGTVRITRPSAKNWGTLWVAISNTDMQTLQWYHARWAGSVHKCSPSGNRRDAWMWVIASQKAAAFLRQIRPYLVRDAVRAKIDHALAFQEQKRFDVKHLNDAERYAYAEEQWNSYWWMGVLNTRGRPEFLS